jgi:hypothetical protein
MWQSGMNHHKRSSAGLCMHTVVEDGCAGAVIFQDGVRPGGASFTSMHIGHQGPEMQTSVSKPWPQCSHRAPLLRVGVIPGGVLLGEEYHHVGVAAVLVRQHHLNRGEAGSS